MFKDKLKELRIKHKVTQRDLSDMFNVSLGAVGNWETGKRMPDTEMLARIASRFNVSVDYLLGRESTTPEISFDNIFPPAPIQEAYDKAPPAIQEAVRKLLDIE